MTGSAAEIWCELLKMNKIGVSLGTQTVGAMDYTYIMGRTPYSRIAVPNIYAVTLDQDGKSLSLSGGIKPDYPIDFTIKPISRNASAFLQVLNTAVSTPSIAPAETNGEPKTNNCEQVFE